VKGIGVVAVLIALVPAAGAASVRSVVAPAPVRALELDGTHVVYATGRSARDCNRVFVWNLATGGVTRLGRRTHCEQTSTGNEIAAVSIAGSRVLWVHHAGGNIRDWSLWTATTTKPMPIRLRLVSRDVDAPAPILIGQGDSSKLGDLLPYAVDRTVIALRANGSRRFTWTAPARVVGLSARDGELAVATAGGTVTVLDAGGRVLSAETYVAEVEEVRLTGSAVIVQRGRWLELTGGRSASIAIPAGTRLADADGDHAVLVGGNRIRTISLLDRRVRSVATGAVARLEGKTLAIASGRTVSVR
jgi:hypothetical protein